MSFVATESIGQLQRDLDAAKESQRYAKAQEAAGRRVITRSHEKKNKLKVEKQQQDEEIERLKTPL